MDFRLNPPQRRSYKKHSATNGCEYCNTKRKHYFTQNETVICAASVINAVNNQPCSQQCVMKTSFVVNSLCNQSLHVS